MVKTPFYLYQRANDLWSYHELSFALIPVIKSNPGSNIRHLSSCGEETRRLFKYSCEKKRCSAFCDEKLMSYISPLVYEKGNISSYIVTSFLLCYLDYHLFPLSPPGLSACPASSLYKTWCYCLLPACVSSLKLIKVYENHNLSLPSGTSTWDCMNV